MGKASNAPKAVLRTQAIHCRSELYLEGDGFSIRRKTMSMTIFSDRMILSNVQRDRLLHDTDGVAGAKRLCASQSQKQSNQMSDGVLSAGARRGTHCSRKCADLDQNEQ
jgi:hypothetical protein